MRYPLNSDSLSNLTGLHLEDNALTGTIPPELGDLASLGGLYLNENELSGGIPPELGAILSLTRIDVSENQLTGGIPREIAASCRSWNSSTCETTGSPGRSPRSSPHAKFHSNGAGLWLSGNQWEGCIPLALLPFLEEADLHKSQRPSHPWAELLPVPAPAGGGASSRAEGGSRRHSSNASPDGRGGGDLPTDVPAHNRPASRGPLLARQAACREPTLTGTWKSPSPRRRRDRG